MTGSERSKWWVEEEEAAVGREDEGFALCERRCRSIYIIRVKGIFPISPQVLDAPAKMLGTPSNTLRVIRHCYGAISCHKQGLHECLYGEVALRDVFLPPVCWRDDYHFGWCVLSVAPACERQVHWSCPLYLWQRHSKDFVDDSSWHFARD